MAQLLCVATRAPQALNTSSWTPFAKSGRNFSAWIGLVPKQHSSGGKERLGSISKQGDRYLRSLFVIGALAVIRYAKIHGTSIGLAGIVGAAPDQVAAIALANKIARMAWAMMARASDIRNPSRSRRKRIAPGTGVVKVGGEQHMQSRSIRRSGPTSAIAWSNATY
jgi:hypothetical protein